MTPIVKTPKDRTINFPESSSADVFWYCKPCFFLSNCQALVNEEVDTMDKATGWA